MENIQNIFKILIDVFLFAVIIRILMRVASYIGEKIGFSRFFKYLWRKFRFNKNKG